MWKSTARVAHATRAVKVLDELNYTTTILDMTAAGTHPSSDSGYNNSDTGAVVGCEETLRKIVQHETVQLEGDSQRLVETLVAIETVLCGPADDRNISEIRISYCQPVDGDGWWRYRTQNFIGHPSRELEMRLYEPDSTCKYPEWPNRVLLTSSGDPNYTFNHGDINYYKRPITNGDPATHDRWLRCWWLFDEETILLTAEDVSTEAGKSTVRLLNTWGTVNVAELDATSEPDPSTAAYLYGESVEYC